MPSPISLAILAGGQSSRMGANKALAHIGGQTIIERIIERISPLGSDLRIITNSPDEYTFLGLPMASDLIPGKGPLGGLYTAIASAQNDYLLAVSCDQPFLNPTLLQFLIGQREGYDVVVPLAVDGYPQSMHAVYGKGCSDPIRRSIEADRLKVIGFFKEVRVRVVAGDEIERIDPQRISFINVNTPDDLAQAELLVKQIE